jgi:hypothetical protein
VNVKPSASTRTRPKDKHSVYIDVSPRTQIVTCCIGHCAVWTGGHPLFIEQKDGEPTINLNTMVVRNRTPDVQPAVRDRSQCVTWPRERVSDKGTGGGKENYSEMESGKEKWQWGTESWMATGRKRAENRRMRKDREKGKGKWRKVKEIENSNETIGERKEINNEEGPCLEETVHEKENCWIKAQALKQKENR